MMTSHDPTVEFIAAGLLVSVVLILLRKMGSYDE